MKFSLALLATAALTATGALALPHGNTEMANKQPMNMSTMEDSPNTATQTPSSSPSSKPSSSSSSGSTPQPSKKAATQGETDDDFISALLGSIGLDGLLG
ncbi:hypothetical protein ASPACDRAFT_120063 [Aspergillus aculeatus ATCC 16872]|uniref:Uncharacterized protein n=1 Tax=Aspergillus aculeatus (strain ATCC 16872 / CBS 172.66 / WB 5094) TaxID=690307 RepID=A0A1L9WV90_ASPA1|nr:uncharacterized protein ASPACDRAFT_120063 [Aspergillus aculeatus ATCC 16872]OJK00033.1 hypothetical protein ASPACDRAFT_120063 [Aspergillus aculeatus ATCC 16872]